MSRRNLGILFSCIGVLALILSVRGWMYVRAQGTELLTNNGMDAYVGGPGGVVPVGWTLTANVPVNSSRQEWVFNEFPGFGVSWKVDTSRYAFTMNAYQFVAGVRAGTPLVFTAYANVFTCDREDSCISADTPRTSQRESGARTRIGIDPTGGTDPNAPTVRWSEYIQPFDQFLPMTVEARSENDNGVTVFLHATQNIGMLLNHVYWDNVSLRAGVGSGGAGLPVPTVRRDVPFVTPQGMQPDGSIIHVVQEGDTLASIAVAYGITVTELRRLNNIPPEEFVIRIGQRLIIKTPAPNVTYIVVTATPTPDPNVTPAFTPFIVVPTNTPVGIIPITVVPITIVPLSPPSNDPTPEPTRTPRLRIPTQDPRRISTVPIRPRSTVVPPSGSGSLPTAESVALALSATPTDPPAATPTGMTVLIIVTPTALPTESPKAPPASPTALPPTATLTHTPSPEATVPAAQPTLSPSATLPMPTPQLPTATNIPPTATQAVALIPTIAQEPPPPDQARLCVIAFDDANTNRLRDQGEPLLIGMQVSLLREGAEVKTLSTAALTPTCFTELAEGMYTLIATPPETYGMTTPAQLQVQIQRGVPLMVSFGAAGSYQPTALPASELPPPSNVAQRDPQRGPLLTFLLENFGLVVAALAAFTLISGLSVALIVRRG